MDEKIKSINNYFPLIFTEQEFVKITKSLLQPLGFTKDNSIAIVCICRDEICQTFFQVVNEDWGLAFNMSGLGGMFIGGKMALTAAINHAPLTSDRQRYIFYAMSHIGIGINGELGLCSRRGIAKSTACGALINFHREITNKKISYLFEQDNVEMSMLKQKLLLSIPYGELPDLLSLTKITLQVIQKDLEDAISQLINTEVSDYALLTGIQIHTENGKNYITPDKCYCVISGHTKKINFDE
ncbi:MAG: hypothetical protein N2738_09615 [Thermodesulfovibrionales bacterium]|nr:hypothetical protein [Thermodesulfovibrionales bacterium]